MQWMVQQATITPPAPPPKIVRRKAHLDHLMRVVRRHPAGLTTAALSTKLAISTSHAHNVITAAQRQGLVIASKEQSGRFIRLIVRPAA